MEPLNIAATSSTPAIHLNTTGAISIVGKSYPENTFEFYRPLMEWMEAYFDGNAAEQTTVNMEIVYFNSSSSKLFFDFFDLLDEQRSKHVIEVNWIFHKENESALEAGKDFKEDFAELTINLVAK
ncbi:MAG: DUF1987 domain-containing protein [Campylobacterales bacterium]|nr:DUF1987 domain-containing protein [Campylobacterales bacterium]